MTTRSSGTSEPAKPTHSTRPGPAASWKLANRAHENLRGALVRAVKRLNHAPVCESDLVSLTRAKLRADGAHIVSSRRAGRGAGNEEQSVVFVTSASIDALLLKRDFEHSAWTIANLYLASLGAELLGEDAIPSPALLSTRLRAFFTTGSAPPSASLRRERRSGCPTSSIASGRPLRTRAKPIRAYSSAGRVAERDARRRRTYGRVVRISEERVDAAVAGVVREAAAARNGWKVTLARRAPTCHAAVRSGGDGRDSISAMGSTSTRPRGTDRMTRPNGGGRNTENWKGNAQCSVSYGRLVALTGSNPPPTVSGESSCV